MRIAESEFILPMPQGRKDLLEYITSSVLDHLTPQEVPIRLAITAMDQQGMHCELGTISDASDLPGANISDCFEFRKRSYVNEKEFNAVLLVPTGIGAELGGHSGDGGAMARLIGGACDRLILHPNVVNGADINEMPHNALYAEGSLVTRLMMGTIALAPTRANRVLVVIDDHEDSYLTDATINSVSAARATMGLACPAIVKLNKNLELRSIFTRSGRAVGEIEQFEGLCDILDEWRGQYDAVAISSMIDVPEEFHADYFVKEMVNPWGGVEAMLTHAVSTLYNIQSAHSPMISSREHLEISVGVVDPRKSAEAVSTTFLHCILKGLHYSPRVVSPCPVAPAPDMVRAEDISCLVIPDQCIGLPTLAAMKQGIPVIAIRSNTNCMRNKLEELPFPPGGLYVVDNYLEAVGVMTALKAGVALDTLVRPIKPTRVVAQAPSEKPCAICTPQ